MKPATVALLALALVPLAGFSQERGRTDGPEGSEFGKGGYERQGGGRYSLALNWGAALHDSPVNGAPLFVGATGSYWHDDWFLLDVSAAYLANSGRFNVLLGPRLRTVTWPISGSLGLKAGLIMLSGGAARFGLSPEVGADMLLAGKLLLGLSYAADVPVGGGDGVAHRVGMNIGYRF